MAAIHSLNLALLISLYLLPLALSSLPVHALNISLHTPDSAPSMSNECSSKCESNFCTVPPLLRYGKYCGVMYSGCPGETPCDGLDACCMKHDACVHQANNKGAFIYPLAGAGAGAYLSEECSKKLIKCMDKFRKSGGHSFKGSTCRVEEVIDVVSLVMKAALFAGRVRRRHNP